MERRGDWGRMGGLRLVFLEALRVRRALRAGSASDVRLTRTYHGARVEVYKWTIERTSRVLPSPAVVKSSTIGSFAFARLKRIIPEKLRSRSAKVRKVLQCLVATHPRSLANSRNLSALSVEVTAFSSRSKGSVRRQYDETRAKAYRGPWRPDRRIGAPERDPPGIGRTALPASGSAGLSRGL